ncbi:MAG: nicotinate mononucleotide-dependent phosphoribosyltransferase CobT [Prochlorococcaceae cyanobacterium]
MTPRPLGGATPAAAAWCAALRNHWPATEVLLVLAATDTAGVEGISAAGATATSRRFTAAADAELLLAGPDGQRLHALPPLPAGVSPALISHVALRGLGLEALVLDLGAPIAPAVPHLRLPPPAGGGPAACLSGGRALPRRRVEALLAQGLAWGRRRGRRMAAAAPPPLLLAESVPGGTTTALAVLCGLGIDANGLVSGSLRRSAHGLKATLVAQGLSRAELPPSGGANDPLGVLAAVGDPLQPFAAGVALAAAAAGRPLLLAGGSQMAAVLAVALALAPAALRPRLATQAAVTTTAWVARETDSDLALLLQRIGHRWRVAPLGFAAGLRFDTCRQSALRDYERGYVKEGVGAGGLAVLWELAGRSPAALASACDLACARLRA